MLLMWYFCVKVDKKAEQEARSSEIWNFLEF